MRCTGRGFRCAPSPPVSLVVQRPRSSGLQLERKTVSRSEGVAKGLRSAFIDVAARADLVDEDRPVFKIREEHSPVANSEAVFIVTATLEAAHVAPALLDEEVDREDDLLACRPVEAGEPLSGSSRPVNAAVHAVSLSSRLISSWEVVSPLARSARASRIAAKSSSVSGSLSAGAASRARRSGSGVCWRYSRYRRAAWSSGSGSSSTSVWSVCRSSMSAVYNIRREPCYHGGAHRSRQERPALNPASAPVGCAAGEKQQRSTAREERGGCAAGSGARWRVFGGRW